MGGIQMIAMRKFTQRQINDMQRAGKIKGYTSVPRGNMIPGRKAKRKGNKIPLPVKRSAEKQYIELNLTYWCNQKALSLSNEFFFDKDPTEPRQDLLTFRNWRFDYAIRSLKIAIEYEGLNSVKSGHTTMGGYTSNADKYNHAAALGWTVLRFTLKNYKTVNAQLNNVYDHGHSR